MPKQKDLKRLVRARMTKTGESYTTARRHVVQKKGAARAPAGPPVAEYPAIAGMSDDAVRNKTGKTWKQWVAALDRLDAVSMPHAKIAKVLREEFDVPGWWAQTVTVGYERIRGLRDIGQQRGGGYSVSKSKTYPVSIAQLYKAFGARVRRRWLDVEVDVKKATVEKSMRLRWPDDTPVDVYFWAKGAQKSQVQLQHRELPSKAKADQVRAFWTDCLADLAALLKS